MRAMTRWVSQNDARPGERLQIPFGVSSRTPLASWAMKTMHGMIGALAITLSAMGAVFGLQYWQGSRHSQRTEGILQRIEVAQSLPLLLEKYRLQSQQFRRWPEPEVTRAKAELRESTTSAIARLETLNPSAAERETGARLAKQIDEFLAYSAKREPQLFLRNVYLLPEAKELHQKMLDTEEELRRSAHQRWEEERNEWKKLQHQYAVAFAALGGLAAFLICSQILSAFLVYTRPMRKLRDRVAEIRAGRLGRGASLKLRGAMGEVGEALDRLAEVVERERQDRRQFVRSIVTDLKVSLVPLQGSASLLGFAGDSLDLETRSAASDHVRRSAVRLGATLADLDDATQVEEEGVRLDEKMIDLREVLHRASQALSGPGATHLLRVLAPSAPVWAWVDPLRLERAVISLVSKLMVLSPQGGEIDLALTRSKGAELRVHPRTTELRAEGPLNESGIPRATGPEQEVERHWSSENGFGLTLAQRTAEAHGGTLVAAGLPGSSVLFALRLPEVRVGYGNRRGGLTAGDFSLSRGPLST